MDNTNNMPQSVQDARTVYEHLRFETLPLLPGQKRCVIKGWPTLDTDALWKQAEPGANIGLKAGGNCHLAFIDCDDKDRPGTYQNVQKYLADLGLKSGDYPVIQSASGIGRQIYIRFDGDLPGHSRDLARHLGAGEFRYGPSVYVVAPPSIVNGAKYTLLEGDLQRLPFLSLDQVLPMLQDQQTEAVVIIDHLPVRLLRRPMPQDVVELLETLAHAEKGQRTGWYPTRSEAEAAVVAKLVLAGWSYNEISDVFLKYRPRKFWELGPSSENYLEFTYRRTISALAARGVRPEITDAWRRSLSLSWKGRYGPLTQATYNALLAICWQCNSWTVRASERDLSEYVAGTPAGVHNALRRLEKDYCLVQCRERTYKTRENTKANLWTVFPLQTLAEGIGLVFYELDNNVEMFTTTVSGFQEIWGQKLLGRTAGIVYSVLNDTPVSVTQLHKSLGKGWATVKTALQKLCREGLAVHGEQGWIRGTANIAEVARTLKAKQAADRRRQRNIELRRHWARRVPSQLIDIATQNTTGQTQP
jgi:DNA-binding transcriptional regulator GbsR (MarR family)